MRRHKEQPRQYWGYITPKKVGSFAYGHVYIYIYITSDRFWNVGTKNILTRQVSHRKGGFTAVPQRVLPRTQNFTTPTGEHLDLLWGSMFPQPLVGNQAGNAKCHKCPCLVRNRSQKGENVQPTQITRGAANSVPSMPAPFDHHMFPGAQDEAESSIVALQQAKDLQWAIQ